jgi:hypothetical protein
MMTRNRIKMRDEKTTNKDFIKEISGPSINRLFRVIFVWSVALMVHQILFK